MSHLLTSFQQDNLVVLREAHETRYHLCELNDLRDDRRQFLRRLHPQALLGLKRIIRVASSGSNRELLDFATHHVFQVEDHVPVDPLLPLLSDLLPRH